MTLYGYCKIEHISHSIAQPDPDRKVSTEADAAEIYASTYNLNAESIAFYEFPRTTQAYKSLIAKNATLILWTDGDLFKYLNGMNPAARSKPIEYSGGDS